MGKRMLLLAMTLAVIISGLRTYSLYPLRLTIDCGAANISVDNITLKTWEIDNQFIKTGENKLLSMNTSVLQVNTLRYFASGERNCYRLPLYMPQKYLIRTGFYYGNYDNLSKPPTFDLEIDGSFQFTVDASVSNQPFYQEIIYVTKKVSTDICLIQTKSDQIPFISSLEAIYVYKEAYSLMEDKKALYLQSRINYGANKSIPEEFQPRADRFNRIWIPEQVPGYRNRSSGYEPRSYSRAENYPPYMVLVSAIEANNVSESIFIPINFHNKSSLSAYFVFYFWELPPWPPANGTSIRRFAVFIDGEEKNVTEVHVGEDCVVVSIYPITVTGTANVTISPAEGTTLPPILNAMEVFTAIDEAASNADKSLQYSSLSVILLYFAVASVWFVQQWLV